MEKLLQHETNPQRSPTLYLIKHEYVQSLTWPGIVMASEALLLWGLIFSSIGLGFLVNGKKQQQLVPFLCGLALMIFP